jgi:hypothetical protein
MTSNQPKKRVALPAESNNPGWEASDEAFLLAQEIVLSAAVDLDIEWFSDSLNNFLRFAKNNKKKVTDRDYRFLVSKTSDLWDAFRIFMMSDEVSGKWNAKIRADLKAVLLEEFTDADAEYQLENSEEFEFAELAIQSLGIALKEDKQILSNAIFENIVILWIHTVDIPEEEFTSIDQNYRYGSSESRDLEFMQLIVELRTQATKQLLYGLAWWVASAVAVFIALGSTGGTVYWFGGAIGALFHWYKAYKLIMTSKEGGAKTLVNNDGLIIAAIIAVVVFSSLKLVPEYQRIETPTLGTCWADTDDNLTVPVACWSSNASTKTIGFAYTAESCNGDYYLEPMARESRFTCLEEL